MNLQFIEDIPNEHWLNSKIEDAKSIPRNSFGVPRMYSITGYFTENIILPIDILKDIPGQRGEQSNIRLSSLNYIRDTIRNTGKLPLGINGQEYLPYIEIGYDGKPWVNEGNHRIMAAKLEGLRHLAIELRYFDGGQRLADQLNPKYLIDMTIRYLSDTAKVKKHIHKSKDLSL